MSQHWERLVDGPRGRLLCALLAQDAERRQRSIPGGGPLGHAMFLTEVGRPGVPFRASNGPGTTADAEHTEFRPTSPEALRTALAGVPVVEPVADGLPGLLEQVADDAWYWQPRQRRDVLLAEPTMVELLRPWAESLGTINDTSWWHDPMDAGDQWFVHPPGERNDDFWNGPVSGRLAEQVAEEVARNEQARALQDADPDAQIAGFWWSTPLGGRSTTRRWPGGRPDPDDPDVAPRRHDPIEVTVLEDRHWDVDKVSWQRLRVPDGVRVLEIDAAEPWVELCREFPLDLSASRGSVWHDCTGRAGDWVVPDWSQVSRRWDGVHLSLAAWLELAGRPLPLDDRRASLIAGWSPDETDWLVDLPLVGPEQEPPHAR